MWRWLQKVVVLLGYCNLKLQQKVPFYYSKHRSNSYRHLKSCNVSALDMIMSSQKVGTVQHLKFYAILYGICLIILAHNICRAYQMTFNEADNNNVLLTNYLLKNDCHKNSIKTNEFQKVGAQKAITNLQHKLIF